MAGKVINMLGFKNGRLTVVKQGPNAKGCAQWWCQCDCGNPELVLVRAGNLRNGNTTKSCGCIAKERWHTFIASQNKVIDMIGYRSGRLVVVERGPNKFDGSAQWLCKCDCGSEKLTLLIGQNLRAGRTRSCGCLQVEHAKELTSNPTPALAKYWNRPTPMATCHPDRPQEAKGLCEPCYNKLKQTYHPEQDKAAYKARMQKPENKSTVDGSIVRNAQLKYLYKINQATFDEMMAVQRGLCACCGNPEVEVFKRNGLIKRLQIEHDHNCCSGKRACGKCIRGLACASCNKILGIAKDNPELLDKLAAYLRAGGNPEVRKIIGKLP